jgi:hypothetical protein
MPPAWKKQTLSSGLLGTAPAKCLIERAGPGEIGDAKRHEADALVYADIIADAGPRVRPRAGRRLHGRTPGGA